ncbi:unnamed protein product, partial [Brenthis ino]
MASTMRRFRVLCGATQTPNALVLQPWIKIISGSLKKTGLRDKFVLLGYESGVLIAIKMAEILEAHGILGTIFCIGGSPDDIKAHFQHKLSIYKTEVDLQKRNFTAHNKSYDEKLMKELIKI